MWISEQATEQVPGLGVTMAVGVSVGMCMCVHMCVLGTTVVVAGLVLNLRMCGGGRTIPGTIPLNHKVRDAQNSRVEHQISPTGLGCPLSAS